MLDKLPLHNLLPILEQLELRDILSVSLASRCLHSAVCRIAFSQILISTDLGVLPHFDPDSDHPLSKMTLSHLFLVSIAPSEPYKNAVQLNNDNCGNLLKLTLTIRASNDLKAVFSKMATLHLEELNLIIEESADDHDHELMRLYQLMKLCNLLVHPLKTFTVTYHAQNEDDLHNSVRLMSLVGLLNQLNWNLCTNVVLNLHINYLHDDPRLELIEELPVTLNIHGEKCCEDDVLIDQGKLKLLSQSYSYLEGAL